MGERRQRVETRSASSPPLDISCIHLQTTREHQGLREAWNSVNPSTAHSIFSLSSPVERLLRSVKITWPFPR
ncbi:hypothetical protein Naga_102214g1 [Nannochloropsis gaditana]|uniref:Uncharacterized protein n=1 Tax=Nannochloropsis gaditana TaxID=72520 RepID=W7TGG6_9STRA|nr:hypothetical protein Naga_102214g1 [Nannochloropsis gaditana]